VLVSGPTPVVPEIALLPVHPPLAVHVFALVVVQLSVELPPLAMLSGDADIATVGAGGVTVTETLLCAFPPEPLQVSVNDVVDVSAPVLCEPLVALLPVQPPVAVQLLAFVLLHVSVELDPDAMLCGLAPSDTVGGGAVTVTTTLLCVDPPAPEQSSVYVVVVVSAPVDCVPLTPLLPDQPLLAVQLVASVVDHVSVELLPLTMLVGFPVNVSVGAAANTVTVTLL
jgi:hypothetical protein